MFILLSKSYLVLDNDDLVAGNNEVYSFTVYNLDSTKPIRKPWNPSDQMTQNGHQKVSVISIVCGAFSSSENYFVLSDNKKNLVLLNRDFEPICSYVTKKNLIKIMFNKKEDTIYTCDKAGDIYEFKIDSTCSMEGKLLLGHCSMLLDFIITEDERFIISCDRDEKIRVTNYPNTYNIMGYCTGHKEFVSTIRQIGDNTCVSGSGDGSIALWDFIDSKRLCYISFDDPNHKDASEKSKFPVRTITLDRNNGDYLCVSFYTQPVIYLFRIVKDNSGKVHSLTKITELSLEVEPVYISFDLCQNNFLWVFGGFLATPVSLFELKQDQLVKAFPTMNLIDTLNQSKQLVKRMDEEREARTVETLFKHHFNNVEIYYQRKKLRVEGNSRE